MKVLINKENLDFLKGDLEIIYQNKKIRKQIKKDIIFGYLIHENRTKETDKELENILKYNLGLNKNLNNVIATWICSKNSKQFMDLCNDISFFKENIIENLI